MAPNRGSGKTRGGKNTSSTTRKPPSGVSKSRPSKQSSGPPRKQQKTKPSSNTQKNRVGKKKNRVYTEKELGLPQLNMITPVGVVAPKGKKKGKVFVDDAESMMTILAMVNADKEGQIESKMMKSRQMEEIREARKAEAEKREQMRRGKLEDTKDSMRKKRKRSDDNGNTGFDADTPKTIKNFKPRKRVSFG